MPNYGSERRHATGRDATWPDPQEVRKADAMSVHWLARISGALATLALVSTAATFPAWAHHSAAPFDLTKDITLRGTVERWQWANPHAWLYLRVAKADGTTEVWGLEAGSTNVLAHSGWTAHSMRKGDTVTITAHPLRNGGLVALLSRVQLANGRVLNQGAGGPPPPRAQ